MCAVFIQCVYNLVVVDDGHSQAMARALCAGVMTTSNIQCEDQGLSWCVMREACLVP
jgi:hypothetical protein